MEVGQTVDFIDPKGIPYGALITAVWGASHGMPGDEGPKPSLNLVYVSRDENETDQYGRQIKRVTSIPHEESQMAHGNYWREDTG